MMGIRVRNTTKGVDKYFTWNIQDLRPLLLFPIIKANSNQLVSNLSIWRQNTQQPVTFKDLTFVWESCNRVFSLMGKIPGMTVKDEYHSLIPPHFCISTRCSLARYQHCCCSTPAKSICLIPVARVLPIFNQHLLETSSFI